MHVDDAVFPYRLPRICTSTSLLCGHLSFAVLFASKCLHAHTIIMSSRHHPTHRRGVATRLMEVKRIQMRTSIIRLTTSRATATLKYKKTNKNHLLVLKSTSSVERICPRERQALCLRPRSTLFGRIRCESNHSTRVHRLFLSTDTSMTSGGFEEAIRSWKRCT